jgi:hypothetical protein
MTQRQDLQSRVPESRACALALVTPQEWNEQPAPEESLIVQ